jgi:hypothetical protein
LDRPRSELPIGLYELEKKAPMNLMIEKSGFSQKVRVISLAPFPPLRVWPLAKAEIGRQTMCPRILDVIGEHSRGRGGVNSGFPPAKQALRHRPTTLLSCHIDYFSQNKYKKEYYSKRRCAEFLRAN